MSKSVRSAAAAAGKRAGKLSAARKSAAKSGFEAESAMFVPESPEVPPHPAFRSQSMSLPHYNLLFFLDCIHFVFFGLVQVSLSFFSVD